MKGLQPMRAEARAQLLLMLGVGSVAACASWSHVVDLAARHGQPGWLALADAAVLETLAVSMGLEVRRRRREGISTIFAVSVLVAAVTLQLSAQVAQAQRTFWGWTMAALPAVGFLVLAKAVITRDHTKDHRDDSSPSLLSSTTRPSLDVHPPDTRQGVVSPSRPKLRAARTPVPDERVAEASREVALALVEAGIPLTRAALAKGLRERGFAIGTSRVSAALGELRRMPTTSAPGETANEPGRGRESVLAGVGGS